VRRGGPRLPEPSAWTRVTARRSAARNACSTPAQSTSTGRRSEITSTYLAQPLEFLRSRIGAALEQRAALDVERGPADQPSLVGWLMRFTLVFTGTLP